MRLICLTERCHIRHTIVGGNFHFGEVIGRKKVKNHLSEGKKAKTHHTQHKQTTQKQTMRAHQTTTQEIVAKSARGGEKENYQEIVLQLLLIG